MLNHRSLRHLGTPLFTPLLQSSPVWDINIARELCIFFFPFMYSSAVCSSTDPDGTVIPRHPGKRTKRQARQDFATQQLKRPDKVLTAGEHDAGTACHTEKGGLRALSQTSLFSHVLVCYGLRLGLHHPHPPSSCGKPRGDRSVRLLHAAALREHLGGPRRGRVGLVGAYVVASLTTANVEVTPHYPPNTTVL